MYSRMSSGSGNGKLGPGCMVLFSMPFAAVGVFCLIWMGVTFTKYIEMRSWVLVEAKILEANLETSTSRSSNGGSSTSYKATAKYTYKYEGKQYTGTRVSATGGADSVGGFQQRAHAELLEYVKSKKPFQCFVNPKDPSEAILYRKMRFEMLGFMLLFTLVFGGVGFGLMIVAIRSMFKKKAERALTNSRPKEPWAWREEWADGRIRSRTKGALYFTIGFAVIWNLISAPLIFIMPGEVSKGNYAALIGLIFPLVGLGMIVASIYQIMKWVKYGESVLEMSTLPGVLGGTLEGIVRTKVNIRPQEGFQLKLSCVRQVVTRSGKSSTTREYPQWEESQTIMHELLERDPTQSAIPVNFEIPYNLPQADTAKSNDCIVWKLEVSADVPGVDYKAEFEVPVFETDESDESFTLEEQEEY